MTEAQRRILADLAAIPQGRGCDETAYNKHSRLALERRGLIKMVGFNRSGKRIAFITEAGRTALVSSQDGKGAA